MSDFSIFWMGWGLAGVVGESFAFWYRGRRKPGERDGLDTLSKNLQWLFVDRGSVWRRASLGLWVGFAIWFANHIWG